MYRRIFSQKQKLVALAFVAFLGIILSGFVASVIAETLDNDVQVEPDSELTYYLKVKYDGVDKEGVQSNDAMDMLEDCGATYRKANENIKRLMNQSIFKKIWINPDGSVEPRLTKICEGVFEAKRDIKKSAPIAVDADSIRKLFKSGSNFSEQGLNNDFL